MTKYIFHVHSFVDLITNSSSELFIATGYKSLEVLKQAVESIIGIDFDLIFDSFYIITKNNQEQYLRDYDCKFPIGTILLDVETNEELRMAIIEKYLVEPLGLRQSFSEFYLGD